MDAWSRCLVLALGGALGVNARYWLGILIGRWVGPRYPWSTVFINVSGSFAIGLAAVGLAHRWPHPLGRLFVAVGFLGGYTTFSTFSYESLKLWEDGERGLAVANAVGSVLAGLAAVFLGVAVGRVLFDGEPPRPDQARAGVESLPGESLLDGEARAG